MTFLNDFVSLVFPTYCLSCQEVLNKNEQWICTHCRFELPKTDYHLIQKNELVNKFRGRVPLQFALAFLKFARKSKVQKILHALKYHGAEEVSKLLGLWYGHDLKANGYARQFDLVVAAPLHEKKRKLRGYNQVDGFAQGIAEQLETDFVPDLLVRNKHTASFASQERVERLLLAQALYSVKNNEDLSGKHILLVDDVITSGATIEACAQALLERKAEKISIATIATAEKIV